MFPEYKKICRPKRSRQNLDEVFWKFAKMDWKRKVTKIDMRTWNWPRRLFCILQSVHGDGEIAKSRKAGSDTDVKWLWETVILEFGSLIRQAGRSGPRQEFPGMVDYLASFLLLLHEVNLPSLWLQGEENGSCITLSGTYFPLLQNFRQKSPYL